MEIRFKPCSWGLKCESEKGSHHYKSLDTHTHTADTDWTNVNGSRKAFFGTQDFTLSLWSMCTFLPIAFPIIVCVRVRECTSAGFWLNPGQTPPHCTKVEATARKSFNLSLWHDNKNPSITAILAGTNWFRETKAAWVCSYSVFFF